MDNAVNVTQGLIIGAVLCVIALCILLIFWRRRNTKRREDKEKIDRKVREDELDRALSNKLHHSRSTQAVTPFEYRYHGRQEAGREVEMLRLTEQSESVTKEYLARKDGLLYLGEDLGRAAVFYQKDGSHVIDCEIFPSDGAVYVRRCGTSGVQLVRGRHRTPLNATGIKVASGDLIEIRSGTFLIEFL